MFLIRGGDLYFGILKDVCRRHWAVHLDVRYVGR